MNKIVALVAILAVCQVPGAAFAGTGGSAKVKAAKVQAGKMQAGKIKMMRMQQAQARAARAGMAAAVVTAATLASTGAGECSPYLAKWMMTRSPAAKIAYDACMDD